MLHVFSVSFGLNSTLLIKKGIGFGHTLRRNCLHRHFIEGKKEGYRWREDAEEDISSYWMILRKREIKSKGLPRQAEVAQGVPGRLRPRILLTFRHYKGGRSSAIRTSRLYPTRNPWYSLSEAESTSGVPGKKIPRDTTRNRSRDLPSSSAVP